MWSGWQIPGRMQPWWGPPFPPPLLQIGFFGSCQRCRDVAVKLKICGLMRASDVSRAVESGASYLGVVFAGGPRAVTAGLVRDLVGVSAGVPVIGVFAGQTVEEILQISERTGLSGTQLHGAYSLADAERLREAGLKVWRVVRIAVPADLDVVSAAVPGSDAVLVEPKVPSV